ncbi:hypothetical protein BpHYR1_051320 [Brachionus plicatilis]|uniref:Uncharacterized protein n=1 Tax=Brachionus plicatilis TaxID=10195 RepID=A0A3M7PW83_BRAPC|nr:hypothetical protein BpHYR1_051320 [Brachionus plicatilis]
MKNSVKFLMFEQLCLIRKHMSVNAVAVYRSLSQCPINVNDLITVNCHSYICHILRVAVTDLGCYLYLSRILGSSYMSRGQCFDRIQSHPASQNDLQRPSKKVSEVFFSGRGTDDMRIFGGSNKMTIIDSARQDLLENILKLKILIFLLPHILCYNKKIRKKFFLRELRLN